MIRPVSIPALVLAALLVAGCAAQPISQAGVESAAAGSGAPDASSEASAQASAGLTASPGAPSASAAASTPVPSSVPVKGPPPKPGNPTWVLLSEIPATGGKTTETYQVTWTEPNGQASKFLVYGLPECLRYAKKYDKTPCVVPGMPIPTNHLVLLGTAPGSARSLNVSWKQDAGAGPPRYSTILMRATNALGKSIFTIVHTEVVCFGCTY